MGSILSHDDPPELAELKKKLFENDLVMREILSYVLWPSCPTTFHSDAPELSPAKARNLRRVSKLFNEQIYTVFEQRLLPLFSFHCRLEDSDSAKLKNRKFLNFMEGLEKGTLESPPPPFSLSIAGAFHDLPMDQWPYLSNLFTNRAVQTLVRLEIFWFGLKTFQWPTLPADLKLPCLREFIYVQIQLGNIVQYKMDDFITSLFRAAVELRRLEWVGAFKEGTLNFDFPRTLRHIIVNFKQLWTRMNTPTPLVFPNVKEMDLHVEFNEFEPDEDFSGIQKKIQQTFPKLEKLLICCPIREDLERWCRLQWKGWLTIKTLNLRGNIHGILPIPRELMAEINDAFAGVVNLELEYQRAGEPHMAKDQFTSGMRYIFEKMSNLKTLKVCIFNDLIEWDLLLLGIQSKEHASQLGNPKLWEEFLKRDEQDQGDGRLSSIRDLKHLERLEICGDETLWNTWPWIQPRMSAPQPQISELLFRLGFMRMPKLRMLTLGFKNLKIGKIAQEWQGMVKGRIVRLG